MTCQKAIGVAKAMKENFKEKLDLKIHTKDSEEAKAYDLRGATTVFVNQEQATRDIITSKEKMEDFLMKLET